MALNFIYGNNYDILWHGTPITRVRIKHKEQMSSTCKEKEERRGEETKKQRKRKE